MLQCQLLYVYVYTFTGVVFTLLHSHFLPCGSVALAVSTCTMFMIVSMRG